MPTLPGMNSDVYFGDVNTPLPNWRDRPDEDSGEDASPEEVAHVSVLLGFDITTTDAEELRDEVDQ